MKSSSVDTRDGFVALYRGTGVIGSLIKWQTRSPYSHASLVYADGQGRPTDLSIEAREFRGVRRHQITPEEWKVVDLFRVEGVTAAMWHDAFAFAERQLSKNYDWRGVARFVTRVPARENDRWFCSELACAAIRYAGIPLLKRIDCHEVSPGILRLAPALVGPIYR